jgi:amiloride-sensitive sodium channel
MIPIFSLSILAANSQICPSIYCDNVHHLNLTDIDSVGYANRLRSIFVDTFDENSFNWKGYRGKNIYYFIETLTDVGYCNTFNLLEASEIFGKNILDPEYLKLAEWNFNNNLDRSSFYWDVINGYSKQSQNKVYPLRSLKSSSSQGFNLQMRMEKKHLRIECENGTQGYKLLLHHPADWPHFTNNFIQLSHNQKYKVIVKPEIIDTASTLESYPSKK